MKIVRIQKMVGNDKIKEWKTILSCRVDCLKYNLWVLQKDNPGNEYRISPLDSNEEDQSLQNSQISR